MSLTLTDLFAGAGGSSTGATWAPGVTVRLAANHWKLACEVHNANHPDTDHAHVDLHQEDPAYCPSTDLLWASPECTKWSQAAGMAIPNEYQWDGTRHERVRMAGNAVTPAAARDLVAAVVEAITGHDPAT